MHTLYGVFPVQCTLYNFQHVTDKKVIEGKLLKVLCYFRGVHLKISRSTFKKF